MNRMKFVCCFLVALISCALAIGNEIIDSTLVTKIIRTDIPNAKLFLVNATDSNDLTFTLPLLHVYGSSYDMGYAHGQIMRDEIKSLIFDDLPFFYKLLDIAKAVDNEFLPDDIREMLQNAEGDDIPEVMYKTLSWIWDTQYPYFQKDSLVEELNGIADGYCTGVSSCDKDRVLYVLRAQNLFPELVRMSCSIVSSHGAANKPGHSKAIQLRALDFGPGPFARSQVLIVRHPLNAQPFASLFFPGAVGVVTSVSPSIAQAEKVWMSHDGRAEPARVAQLRSIGLEGPRMQGLRPGTYDGISDIFAIRSIMEQAQTPSEAAAMAKSFKRTWPIFLGFAGPGTSADNTPVTALAYEPESVALIDDTNNDFYSGTGLIKDVVYLNRHVQPSSDATMHDALQAQHGQIDGEWVVQNIPALTKTGDVHIMLVDWNTNSMFISIGYAPLFVYDKNGNAYERPFMKFNMKSLWAEQKP